MDYLVYLILGLLFLLALGCKIYFSLHPEKMERFRAELAEAQKSNTALPYRARPSLLTPAELKFYEALRPLVAGHWHLFSKVRMEDILEVKPGLEKKEAYGYRSRIKSRHIDFVLCDKGSLEVLMCIELDDSSHQRKAQQEADKFKNEAMAAAGITLTRVPVQTSYSEDYLKGLFFEDNNATGPLESAPSQASDDPHARYRRSAPV